MIPNSHQKRRHEDDGNNDQSGDPGRVKRRMIQTFESLSLKGDANNNHMPRPLNQNRPSIFEPSSKPLLIQSQLAPNNTFSNNNAPIQSHNIVPPGIRGPTNSNNYNQSKPTSSIKNEEITDFMDTSGPHTVFIPSIDDFLAQEASDNSSSDDDENYSSGYESGSSSEHGSSSRAYGKGESDMELDDSLANRRHVLNSRARKKRGTHGRKANRDEKGIYQNNNQFGKFQIVNKAARNSVMRVPDAVLRSSSRGPNSNGLPQSFDFSRKNWLGSIPDTTSMISVPGVCHHSSYGFSGSGPDGSFRFYEKPTYELILYEPRDQVVWKHFAKWAIEKQRNYNRNNSVFPGSGFQNSMNEIDMDVEEGNGANNLNFGTQNNVSNNSNNDQYYMNSFRTGYDSPTFEDEEPSYESIPKIQEIDDDDDAMDID